MSTPARFVGMYDFKETLGKGHYSVVKLAQHVITKDYVAVKIIEKHKLDEVELKHLTHEVRVMKLLRHPNVIRLFEVVDTPSCLFLILELGEGGDMYEHIKENGRASEERARDIFAQLVRAMSYCHANRVAHRDLKPENVVFCIDPETRAETIKVTDFGLCNNFTDEMMMETFCGSMVYSPPEVLLQEPYAGPKADVWSMGIMLYMIIAGALPFQESNDSETLIKILEVVYEVPDFVSEECADLLSKVLVRDPDKRLSIKEIAAHPWLRPVISDTELKEINGTAGTAHKVEVSKSLHDRCVVVLDRQAGITKAQVEESLKKESYDYVASTYYLVLEQQLRQDQMRRHYAQAGHAAQAQARTGSAGDDYDSHPLSPGPGTPGLSVSTQSVPNTPTGHPTPNLRGSRSGKTGQLRRRVRPLSATGQHHGLFSPTSPPNHNLTDIASLALSPRLPPGTDGTSAFPDFDQTWPGPWSGGSNGADAMSKSFSGANLNSMKQSFQDVNHQLRTRKFATSPSVQTHPQEAPLADLETPTTPTPPRTLLLPDTQEEDEHEDEDIDLSYLSNLSRNSSLEGSVSGTPRSKKLVRSGTCGSSLDGSFDGDDVNEEEDDLLSLTPRPRLTRAASHGASLMSSNNLLMAVTEEAENSS